MTFNIIGEYCFTIPVNTMFLNNNIYIKHRNLITLMGESFFLNRCINDLFNPIQYICIGNGINAPEKLNEKLDNETKRNTCIQDVDLNNKRLILKTSFTTEEIIGATEIGVLTTNHDGTEVLISRDVFNDTLLKEDFLYGVTGSITLEYSFYFTTSQMKTGWNQYTVNKVVDKNVYWVFEPNEVLKVHDNTTNYGLKQMNSIQEVQDNKNSYYHDITGTYNLYIHLHHYDIDDEGRIVYAPNPNTHDIQIENK